MPNYDYSIDGGGTYSSTMIHNNLGPGNYIVMVRDANGCTNDTTIIITEPLPFTINASSPTSYNGSDVSCHGACGCYCVMFLHMFHILFIYKHKKINVKI